jgi:hypothetical protein
VKDRDLVALLRLARSDAGPLREGTRARRDALAAVERLVASSDLYAEPLVPVICRGARRLGLFDELSEAARDDLDRARLEAVARALRQRRWLADTFAELEQHDIVCVLLKGAAFQGYLYADDAPRLGGDIDLLVRSGDFEAACQVLDRRARRAGPRRDRRASHEVGYEVQYLTDGPFAVLVELHRALTIPDVFAIDHEQLFAHSLPHPHYASEAVRMLDPVGALLHLAVHGFRHMRLASHTLLDTHELWNLGQPDPVVLASRADAWGAKGALFLLLRAASDIVGTPVPPELLTAIEPGPIRKSVGLRIYRYTSARDLKLLDAGYRLTQLASLVAVPDRATGVARFGMRYAGWRALDFWERLKNTR